MSFLAASVALSGGCLGVAPILWTLCVPRENRQDRVRRWERQDDDSVTSSREAVGLAYESGRRLVDVARELDVRPDLIRRWRRKLSGGTVGRPPTTEEQEIRRLQRQVSELREERDIHRIPLNLGHTSIGLGTAVEVGGRRPCW